MSYRPYDPRETQRVDTEVRLRAKEAGCLDALDGLPPDPLPETVIRREEWSGYRWLLATRAYGEGYAEGSEPLPF